MLKMKRVYETYDKDDGYRILVDRLWPRGVSKEKAAIDNWAKEITPSTKIREEFKHEAKNFEEFKKNYLDELNHNENIYDFIDLIKAKLKEGNVTFIYAAKDPVINHVVILKEYIEQYL